MTKTLKTTKLPKPPKPPKESKRLALRLAKFAQRQSEAARKFAKLYAQRADAWASIAEKAYGDDTPAGAAPYALLRYLECESTSLTEQGEQADETGTEHVSRAVRARAAVYQEASVHLIGLLLKRKRAKDAKDAKDADESSATPVASWSSRREDG